MQRKLVAASGVAGGAGTTRVGEREAQAVGHRTDSAGYRTTWGTQPIFCYNCKPTAIFKKLYKAFKRKFLMRRERTKHVVGFSVECCPVSVRQGALTDLRWDQGPSAWKLRRTLGAAGFSELGAVLCIVGGGGASLVSTH